MKDSSTSPSGPKEGLKSLKEGPSGPQEGPSGPVIAQGLVFGPLSCPDIETRDCPRIHLWAFLNSAKQCIRLLVLSIYFSLSLSGAANGRTFGAADMGPFVLRHSQGAAFCGAPLVGFRRCIDDRRCIPLLSGSRPAVHLCLFEVTQAANPRLRTALQARRGLRSGQVSPGPKGPFETGGAFGPFWKGWLRLPAVQFVGFDEQLRLPFCLGQSLMRIGFTTGPFRNNRNASRPYTVVSA